VVTGAPARRSASAKRSARDRFQQVIECMHFERLQREFIIGRHKNDERSTRRRIGQVGGEFDAAHAGHLHVQQDDVRPGHDDAVQCALRLIRFADQLVRILRGDIG